jgi:hypothetical protein
MNEELMEMLDDETITFPEFDNCLAGVVIRANGRPVVCYDYYKVIEKLKLDMSEEDAIEHFYFNIVGSYLGELTPCFLFTSPPDDDSTDL